MYKFVIVFVFFVQTKGQYEGDLCVKNGATGVCRNLRLCQEAIIEIRKGIPPQTCSFDRNEAIVCCIEKVTQTTTKPPVATTTKKSTTTTTEYIPPEYTYVDVDNTENGCEPIPLSLTAKKNGRKAWDKCLEYQEKLIYPCEKAVALTGGLSRGTHCHHNADQLIIGGQKAERDEFPHMALLGYGQPPNIQWLCGGTLISEKFILTAGHCISSRDAGNLTYAYIGALERKELVSPLKRYGIKRIIRHPGFKPPVKYNDITLLETDRPVTLDQFTVPACLPVGNDFNDEKASATGWGNTLYSGNVSEILQKVILTKYSHEECSEKYQAYRLMSDGVDEKTQFCYGDRTQSKDTCQGDSGGPLQVKSTKIHCMYVVIGVTSFGRACGFVDEPGIYTQVSAYVPWIESVVWP